MSAAPQPLASREARERAGGPEPAARSETELRAAPVRLGVVAAAAASIAAVLALRSPLAHEDWPRFLLLAGAATLAQALPLRSPRTTAVHTAVVFLVAAALLLPPELVVLVPVVQTLPEWVRERARRTVRASDLAGRVLAGLAAWGAADAVDRHGAGLARSGNARFALAGLAACVAFVALAHLIDAAVVRAGRGRTARSGGLVSLEPLSVDLVLTLLGVSFAAFWQWDPWLVVAALAPLVVVHRSLSVSQLQAEARIDPKTGLYNARYFSTTLAAELARAARFERPMALIMADLDLLRDLNNTYGHLAGDAVLRGIADVFRSELRHYDVPARFGGEEFSILLPETTTEQALEIAERIRRAVAEQEFAVATAPEPLRATVSLGVAGFPDDGLDANELIHQADLAVYRAKLQGRNRVLAASSEPLLLPPGRPFARERASLRAVPDPAEDPLAMFAEPEAPPRMPAVERRRPRSHEIPRPHVLALSGPLGLLVAAVGVLGIVGGAAGLVWGDSRDVVGIVAMAVLVGGGQALSFEVADVAGAISVGVVGSLAGAALFDYRAALPLAAATAVADRLVRRTSLRHAFYTTGTLALAALGAAAVSSLGVAAGGPATLVHALVGMLAGALYFGVAMTLLSLAAGLEGGVGVWGVFRERCAWLLPHYVVYGFIGGVIAVAYEAVGLYALAVFAVPLLLMHKTQQAYLSHTERSAQKLREAADTIRNQNVSLELANRLLRERSTAAMESLSATVDARDAYTAGHSRRVQQLALTIGRELGLSQAELDLLDRAALFHDIGKLAVPDAVLLKPGSLTDEEWRLMKEHAEEGARIIERLGFLQDAVPAIRHHHERWDGRGYPDGLGGDDIPLGARVIHVADALDSMLTTRVYRSARSLEDALEEIRRATGTQFCPRCVAALERLLPLDASLDELPSLVEAS